MIFEGIFGGIFVDNVADIVFTVGSFVVEIVGISVGDIDGYKMDL